MAHLYLLTQRSNHCLDQIFVHQIIIIHEPNLCFSVSELPVVSVSHSNLTVVEGNQVTVSCNGTGLPTPNLDWSVNGLHSTTSHMVCSMHLFTGSDFKLIYPITAGNRFYWVKVLRLSRPQVSKSRPGGQIQPSIHRPFKFSLYAPKYLFIPRISVYLNCPTSHHYEKMFSII